VQRWRPLHQPGSVVFGVVAVAADRANYHRFLDGSSRLAVSRDTNMELFPVLLLYRDPSTKKLIPGVMFYRQALISLDLLDDCRTTVPAERLGSVNRALVKDASLFPFPTVTGTVAVINTSGDRQMIRVTHHGRGDTECSSGWYVSTGKQVRPTHYSHYYRWDLSLGQVLLAVVLSTALSAVCGRAMHGRNGAGEGEHTPDISSTCFDE
jgi:hypothetical protein